MGISESLLLLWLFCCVFVVVTVSLYKRVDEGKNVPENRKLNIFTLIMINVPAFVFSFFMLVVMIIGVCFMYKGLTPFLSLT